MKNYEFIVYRPTVFRIEAESAKDAKQKIIDGLVSSGQAKPSSQIIIEEICDAKIKETKKEKDNTERPVG